MRTIGIVPARMKASRFPGKPLHNILGEPMLHHVMHRANLFPRWEKLVLATEDKEILDWAAENSWHCYMTSDSHVRCLDRVAEAASLALEDIDDEDLVVCVQGDEPILHPDMIQKVVDAATCDPEVPCSVLTIGIKDEEQYLNKDIVKLVHDTNDNVLYTSRSPIPYCEEFSEDLGAKRIGGIFAFKWWFLKAYTQMEPTPLELLESCDSNRICGAGYKQKVAFVEYRPCFSVDSPEDIITVEKHMREDKYHGTY